MNTHALLQLLLSFALVALLPLCWVWVSREPDKFRKLAWVALFLTFDLIVFGGFTRLTDSGLGCPDWPGCYGHANPFQAQAHIDAAAAAMPDGPVTRSKAWIEMIHRYLAGAIGVLCIALLASAWRLSRKRRAPAYEPGLPALLLLCVCVQGGFGAATVTLKLQPVIVTMHLLLGMFFLTLMTRLAVRQVPIPALPRPIGLRLRPFIWLAMVLLFCQMALGAWVSTNYATLACTEFPLCQGKWVPEMDFAHGFALWRELGKTANGDYLPFAALTAIHWVHRSFAWLAALALLAVWWQVRRMTLPASGAEATDQASLAAAGLRQLGNYLVGVLLLQVMTGLATIYFNFPLAIAVLHNAGAALLVLLLTMVHYRAVVKTA